MDVSTENREGSSNEAIARLTRSVAHERYRAERAERRLRFAEAMLAGIARELADPHDTDSPGVHVLDLRDQVPPTNDKEW
jgi:hypothetical protein